FGEHGGGGTLAASQQRPAEVIPLQPDLPLLAIGRAILRQQAQTLEQRVVSRGDGDGRGGHGSAPSSGAGTISARATGANERRCIDSAPCTRSACMCCAVP